MEKTISALEAQDFDTIEFTYDSEKRISPGLQELKDILQYKDLIFQLVRRDIVARYKRSVDRLDFFFTDNNSSNPAKRVGGHADTAHLYPTHGVFRSIHWHWGCKPGSLFSSVAIDHANITQTHYLGSAVSASRFTVINRFCVRGGIIVIQPGSAFSGHRGNVSDHRSGMDVFDADYVSVRYSSRCI